MMEASSGTGKKKIKRNGEVGGRTRSGASIQHCVDRSLASLSPIHVSTSLIGERYLGTFAQTPHASNRV